MVISLFEFPYRQCKHTDIHLGKSISVNNQPKFKIILKIGFNYYLMYVRYVKITKKCFGCLLVEIQSEEN